MMDRFIVEDAMAGVPLEPMQPSPAYIELRDKIAIEVEQCSGFVNRSGQLEYPCSSAKNQAEDILAIVWAAVKQQANRRPVASDRELFAPPD